MYSIAGSPEGGFNLIWRSASVEQIASGYGLIEGPVWDGQQLLFSDVLFGGVFAVTPAGAVSPVVEHRKGIGGMSLHEAGGLVVSGRNVAYKPLPTGDTVMLRDRDPDNGNVGYNDITTDGAGRIYAGSLGNSPVFDDGRTASPGALFLIDVDGSSRQVADGIGLTNGLGFSPDGRTLYHSDSRVRTVWQYDVSDDGSLSEKRPFVLTERGVPDGLVVAEDGAVWVALAGGGKGVVGYGPDAVEVGFHEIPEPMCTSVCFGGDDLRDLYIVSGSDGTGHDRGGAIHRVRVDVPGLPVPKARVQLPG